MPSKYNKKTKKLADGIKNCIISSPVEDSAPKDIVIADTHDPALCSKWPKVKMKVPDIFLHKPVDFAKHVCKLLKMGIKFNEPFLSRYYTKITCPTFNDHRALIQYFGEEELPYHTFGHPKKRKMKVVIRGLPKDVDLNKLKSDLKAVSVPIIRVHKMKRGDDARDTTLILAVVPHNDEGMSLLRVKKILGYNITMEPPKSKTRQCHRCQMWGHTQRFCQGQIKCVKCGGEHLSKKCERDANKEPPKCANCGGQHTASYRQCPCCPDSFKHQLSQLKKHNRIQMCRHTDLVTMENSDTLCEFCHINLI